MLRKRKNRRYNETNDEEGDGERKFDLALQIKSERFDQVKDKHLQELSGDEITLRLIQRHGFEKPILVEKPNGLDLRVPPKSFLVRDVRNCVGHQRIIDVMDVKTQKNIEMSMKDWCKYYESKNRDRLLNVISLEFSHTELDELVESPMIVRLLDWVDLVWPKFLKESQTESTNTIDKMKYPKVQKYCLMSVKGSYTDFHIDFGGTSVWYHILRGRKIFWMVPPTELNLQVFEEWTLSGQQQDVFFGDTVEECFRVELSAGNTFFIPSGWIHAVYTLEDSLVFGGNFLHSFGIENQLKVSRIEDATKVPHKFRYPFYTEILWYVVQHYVYCLTNKDHLHRPDLSSSNLTTPEKSSRATKADESKRHKNNNSATNNNVEIEDETTESERQESDTSTKKKVKKISASNKRKRGRSLRSSASSSKRTKKQPQPPSDDDDDESTDIDSANEELVKATAKPSTNTCRMTKNSLLRLQYEIDDQQTPCKTTNKLPNENSVSCNSSKDASNKSTTSKKKNSATKEAVQTDQSKQTQKQEHQLKQQQEQQHQQATSASNPLNFAEIMLTQNESKLNGWSGSGGQTVWSNPNTDPKESFKIHITRYELSGLKVLVKHLSKLSGAKKNLPNLIRNSRALLDDCRKLIIEHENDDPELAITGKPINPELLNSKKTDMNELIGQFFKQSEAICDEKPLSKTEISIPSSTQRLKTLEATPKGDEKKSSTHHSPIACNDNSSPSSTTSPSKLSPHKETKCLSPNKKLLSSTTPLASSSPPPRPKSPPTRPLSNNQYTSKTKTNSNLLLPGSFADLIAATSTEKKVFDMTGTDVASSLFSVKDLSSPTKSSHSPSSSSTKKEKSDKLSLKCHTKNISTASSKTPSSSSQDSISPGQVASTTGAGAGSSNAKKDQPKTNSPEPPKSNIQKRFITPASFRPHNKEKLIYASAPYVSPVHATDQTRSTYPYPWQTPTHPQPTPAAQPSSHTPVRTAPTYTPTTRQATTTTESTVHSSPSLTAPSTSSANSNGQTTYAPDSRPPTAAQHLNLTTQGLNRQQQDHHNKSNPIIDNKSHHSSGSNQHPAHKDNKEAQKQTIDKAQKQPKEQGSKVSSSIPGNTNNKDEKSKVATPSTTNSLNKPDVKFEQSLPQATVSDSDVKVKKPTKPRGPPKKSKEARQAIEASTEIRTASIPVSVIKSGPLIASTSGLESPAVAAAAAAPPPKQKNKRSKKSKDAGVAQTAGNLNTLPSLQTVATSISQPILSQRHPSVICGLVAPPTSSTGTLTNTAVGAGSGAKGVAKINPQSYLISRPLLFNTMPGFSAAQFQQMPRTPMPLFTTPIGSPLTGLPFQQGARIVWATQPRGFPNSPVTTNNIQTTSTPQSLVVSAPTPTTASAAAAAAAAAAKLIYSRPPVTTQNTHSDNAALLSLATTALSTASMISSPALSQLSNRAPAPQAIMVSSAANQPALFAGQQFFRPFIQQRMPMTAFAPRPGVPRPPGGQLVFARLPNQSQPRYLITQPGFMQQRFQAPAHTSQATSTLAYTTIKPPETAKPIKTKKVKTS